MHSVRFHPLARTDLFDLYAFIEARSGPRRAGDYLARIERVCSGLAAFPERGTPRPDLAPDVRTIAMERRVLIVFRVRPEEVLILRVLYAGRDFDAADIPE